MRLICDAVKTQRGFVAERIDSLPPARASRRIYPWNRWTDGTVWRIRQGEDFEVSPESMASMIRVRAKTTGLTVATRVHDDVVTFQFFGPEEKAA